MLPEKSDPRWKRIVIEPVDVPLKGLATKMMLMRVRMIFKVDSSPTRLQEAIDLAYDFFSKNEAAVRDDIAILFKK